MPQPPGDQVADQPLRDAHQIAQQFALGAATAFTGPHARGFQAEVWKLQTQAGTWAVKRSFDPVDEAELQLGAEFQEAARAAGVATPRIVRGVDGCVLADVRWGQVRVDEWVDLADSDPTIDAADVGAAIATMHQVTTTSAGEIDPWYCVGVGADRWVELIAQLRAGDAPFADDLGRACGELVAMEELVEPPVQLRLCHRDLWADNVRRGADGRIWVIDWQDCGAADVHHELAALLFEYAYDDRRRARSFHESYARAGGPARVERPQDFSMAIAQLGHILEFSCRNWLAAQTPDQRTLNEGRVSEFITKPLSRRLFDTIVAAVRA
jgi:Ser/Thr protein kinase RdoA (MazF antagonist)